MVVGSINVETGTLGNDDLVGDPAKRNILLGFAGDDELTGGQESDLLLGNRGDDDLWGGDGDDVLRGGKGDDDLWGGDGDDVLRGGKGDDDLWGGDGDDLLRGGKGDDDLHGGEGDDVLRGGKGDDYLRGGEGNDTARGGAGDDTYAAGAGDDTFVGGGGHDTYDAGGLTGFTGQFVFGFGGQIFKGTFGRDVIGEFGPGTLDVVEKIIAPLGRDNNLVDLSPNAFSSPVEAAAAVVDLGAGTIELFDLNGVPAFGVEIANFDDIVGTANDDILKGDDGDNIVLGRAGNDIFIGTAGNDVFDGGANAGFDTADYSALGEAITFAQGGRIEKDSGGIDQLGSFDPFRVVDKVIADAGFTNTIDNSGGFNISVDVDLTAGLLAATVEVPFSIGGTSFAAGDSFQVEVENFSNIVGTTFAETLKGDAGDNVVIGGGGDDIYIGTAGNDTYDSGPNGGFETIDYSALGEAITFAQGGRIEKDSGGIDQLGSFDPFRVVDKVIADAGFTNTIDNSGGFNISVDVDLTAGLLAATVEVPFSIGGTSFAAGDSFQVEVENFSNIVGTTFAETLKGDAGDNVVIGGGGDDIYIGTAGNDTYDSGPNGGFETIDYSALGEAITFAQGGRIEKDSGGIDQLGSFDPFRVVDKVIADAGFTNTIDNSGGFNISVDVDLTAGLLAATVEVPFSIGGTSFAAGDSFQVEVENFSNIVGTTFAETLIGNQGENEIFGGDGDDDLFGGGGDDFLQGNAGDDTIEGGEGADVLRGGKNNDELFGGGGADDLFGDLDDDFLQGNAGEDTLEGGDGDDDLRGGKDDDELFGGDGNDRLRGDLGDDFLQGNAGEDLVEGGDGNDDLRGGKDDDELFGGDGNDRLRGDLGDDVIDTGAGQDTVELGVNDGTDLVLDFSLMDDTLFFNIAGIDAGDLTFSETGSALRVEATSFAVAADLAGFDLGDQNAVDLLFADDLMT